MSYASLWGARWRMLRPGNATMAAIGVVVGAVLVGGGTFADVLAAAIAAFLITGFGNVLNDLQDVRIDREIHPERPLAKGDISASEAKAFAGLLLAVGLWEAFAAAGVRTFLFAGANALLLVAYELRLKRMGLVGNLAVGALVASTFLFGAATVDGAWRAWGLVWALAAMAFLANVARELMKDVQDLEGDREDRRTFPMQAGRPLTLALAFVLIQAAVGLSVVAWLRAPWPPFWGVLLLAADVAFVVAAAGAWLDVGRGQRGLKVAMVLSLAAFGFGAMQQRILGIGA